MRKLSTTLMTTGFLLFPGLILALEDPRRDATTAASTGEKGRVEVSGRVENAQGLPIEQAFVTVDEPAQTVFTNGRGEFLAQCALPCHLTAGHTRFSPEVTSIETAPGEPLRIVLLPKQEVFEELDVTASRGDSTHFAPLSVASTVVDATEKAAAPSTLTEIVEGVPGVAENGQGGLFQVFSIRGVSRHRVLTLVDGIPITSERRAGVSTSFIDPLLIGSVDVLRGPASTYYGSGALGGVVQVFPRSFQGLQVESGYRSFGDERYVRLGYAGGSSPTDSWSVSLAHRQVDDDEVADGTLINAHYQQTSAILTRKWQAKGLNWSFLAIPTLGEDIGKPNTDFPDRVTEYPREEHLLMRLEVASENGWSLSAYLHPNTLQTDVLRVDESLSVVDNESLELGASWLQSWDLEIGSFDATGRVGVDYFARHRVEARETIRDLETDDVQATSTLDGRQDEVAAFGSLRWSWGRSTWQSGARFTWQQQSNRGFESRDDGAWSAFVGVVQPLGQGFELTANVGTGLRFANLSERFFTGSTGRGQVLGNPGLDPERGINADLGVRWYGSKTFLSAQVFRLDIDDYIERITLDDDRRTFVNLSSGTIEGIEIEGFYQWSERWTLNWGGHLIDGEDDDQGSLADVPADRLQLGIQYARGDWLGRLQYQLRAAKDDVGSGELPLGEAHLLSASLRIPLVDGLAVVVRGRNLLDEEYRNSADDKVTIAAGRSYGISFSWFPG